MGDVIQDESISFERLADDNYSFVGNFENREKELVEFLRDDALENQKMCVSTTFLVFVDSGKEKKLVGYVTLLADSVRIKERKELEEQFRNKGIRYPYLPAVKIGRMAVDEKYQRKGIGRAMIKFSVGIAEKLNAFIGCRFLTVDAKEGARAFYEKLGFKVFLDRAEKPTPMYLDLLGKA
jgi:GNAT superfamily N-acetyltransferase